MTRAAHRSARAPTHTTRRGAARRGLGGDLARAAWPPRLPAAGDGDDAAACSGGGGAAAGADGVAVAVARLSPARGAAPACRVNADLPRLRRRPAPLPAARAQGRLVHGRCCQESGAGVGHGDSKARAAFTPILARPAEGPSMGPQDDVASSYSAALGAGRTVTTATAYHGGLVVRRPA